MCSAPTSRKAGACSARPHQRHGEATGAETVEAAGRTSRRSVNGLNLRAWTSAPGAVSGDTSSTRTTRRTNKPTAEHPAGVRRHAPAPVVMSRSILMNELTIVGNLTADPTLRRSANGRGVIRFDLAINRQRFHRDTNTYDDLPPV